MSADLRALLQEMINAGHEYSGAFMMDWCDKARAALAEPAPEPYYECKICGERVLFRRMVVQQITPTETIETGPYCKKCQQETLSPASPAEKK